MQRSGVQARPWKHRSDTTVNYSCNAAATAGKDRGMVGVLLYLTTYTRPSSHLYNGWWPTITVFTRFTVIDVPCAKKGAVF